ncbi:hydroxysqualene dehydroxylase HpnE [Thiohalophilus sp.]|uniref:hydroxysqualene dehydroxylase HpnE n=1 Tax=Thiohalophilus sp. TaxID=3028392 RepID=UPI0039763F4A
MKQAPVVIVGGGWAGLAAAADLAARGLQPLLLEAGKQPGGRARKVAFAGQAVDNGQHLFIGAYHHTLRLLKQFELPVEELFKRQPLHLTLQHPQGPKLSLRAPRLPAPLHLLWALLNAQGLSTRSRWQALKFGWRLSRHKVMTQTDQSVLALLRQWQQPRELIESFWTPLCLAIMNTPVGDSSAELFLSVLRDAFLHQRVDSDLLYARRDLGHLFSEPAMQYIEHQGGEVQLGRRVLQLHIEQQQIRGIVTGGGEIRTSQVILAVPPRAAAALCESHPELAELQQQCSAFEYEPICTIYLQYPKQVQLPQPMLGLLGGLGQWVFDRRLYGQHGLLAVVISTGGKHMRLTNAQLISRIGEELQNHFPHWPAHEQAMVIREKRATFASRVGINSQRPDNHTAIDGLWLAGDYTRTNYPATLEGAVKSGLQCATLAHRAVHTPRQDAFS